MRYVLAPMFRPTLAAQARFFRGMASQTKAGIAIGRGLSLMATHGPGGFRSFCRMAEREVNAGGTLSSAMSKRPDLFDPFVVHLVRGGEVSGDLEEVFNALADHAERERESYMALITGAALPVAETLVFVGLAVYLGVLGARVIPASLAVLLAAAFLIRVVLKWPGVSTAFDLAKACIPIVGGITRNFAAARFCRVAGALFHAGVSIPESFSLGGDASGSPILKQQIRSIMPALHGGSSLAEVMERVSYLPPAVREEILTAETTGLIDDALKRMAVYCSSNGHTQLAVVARVLPVFLLLFYVLMGFSLLSGILGDFGSQYKQVQDLLKEE